MARQIIDQALLVRLAALNLRAGQVVEGVLTGMHKSPHHGASVEFAQHREYVPGDELRHIDWKAFGRSDRYVIKQYEDETNLRAYLLVDTSGSMDYGRKGLPTKLEYGSQVAAALAWLLLRQGDATGLLTFGDKPGRYLPPRARADHFWRIAEQLEAEPVGGATNAVGALQHIAEVAGRRSLILLFSDCFDFDPRLAAIARQLRRRRHRVAVFQVLDPNEIDFPFDELTLFEDMETEERLLADPRGMRDEYIREINDFCDKLRKDLLEGDVTYHRLVTSEPIERAVLRIIQGAA